MAWTPTSRAQLSYPEFVLCYLPICLLFAGGYGARNGILGIEHGVVAGLVASFGAALVLTLGLYPFWRVTNRFGKWAEHRRSGLRCRCGKCDFEHADIVSPALAENYELERGCRCSCGRTYAIQPTWRGLRLVEVASDGQLVPHLTRGHFSPWRADSLPVKSKHIASDWVVPFVFAGVFGVVGHFATLPVPDATGGHPLSRQHEGEIIRLVMVSGLTLFGFIGGCVMIWRNWRRRTRRPNMPTR